MLNQDTLREATRLTHAGQLGEATALLQRMLRGERTPEATRSPRRVSLPGREPATIDVTANALQHLVRRTVGRWVDREYRRRPMLVPMVVEV